MASNAPAVPLEERQSGGPPGARVHHRYHDRTEDTVAVTRDDLSDVRDFGPLQQILFGTGSFLFSGAFWLAIALLIEHRGHYADFVFGFLLCAISMVAGGAVAYVGVRLFRMKQARLDKYFPNES